MQTDNIIAAQRKFFKSGTTLSVIFRIKMLRRLHNAVKEYEDEICSALATDLGKSAHEGFMCEIALVLDEINYMLRHIKKFSAKKRVKTPLSQFAAASFTQASPYGNVLIISPWNYPFLLTMEPLTDAIAAGNTVIIKPSAYSPATSSVIEKIVGRCFSHEYVSVITGGRKENAELLNKKFDMIFFTGSQAVGKEVLRHAAENLTPVVLELGGKSPCIVDSSANIPLAARRIVFGKFLNCGQTCVAPDYILCEKSVKNALIREISSEIVRQFGHNPLDNPSYGHIVNKKHFSRLLSLIDENKVVTGGEYNEEALQIAPTIMDGVAWNDSVMQEEIFGPILPILTYENFNDIFEILEEREKPLALYIFSESSAHKREITEKCSFGGGCINDVVIHLASSELGFGGVGESGMGAYHGKVGFYAFSHTKSIVDKKTCIDLPIRYQPYKKPYYKLLHILFK